MWILVVVASVMVIVTSADITPRPAWQSDEDVIRKEINEELEFAFSDRNLQRIYDLFVNGNGVLPQLGMLQKTTPPPTHRRGSVRKRRFDMDDTAKGFPKHVETAVQKAKAAFLAFLIEDCMQQGKKPEADALVLMLMDTLDELHFDVGLHNK